MDRFAQAMEAMTNKTYTENGQLAYKSTGVSKVLDFFAIAGAMRSREDRDIVTKMADAYAENPALATRLLFHLSDIREGLGERHTFRVALRWMAEYHPKTVMANLPLIPFFNRWDSAFVLIGTPCEQAMVELVRAQLKEDLAKLQKGESVSLLAKWLPSVNASSKETRKMANFFIKKLNLTPRTYRLTLSALREHLKVVETKMSAGKWDEIAYSQVPSRAMMGYRKAFWKHDEEGFGKYIAKVKSGEETIKASTLYPYDIVEKLMGYGSHGGDDVLEEQWKALPNYIEEENNVLVMADVSGSMNGRPMATSVGLAMYFAERNNGPYHNMFLTFSGRPEYVKLKGFTLRERISNAMSANWDQNTNLEAAFNLVLQTALQNRLSNDELPKAIVVISDMEIDSACRSGDGYRYGYAPVAKYDFMTTLRKKFESYGYTLPSIVYWNVDSRQDTYLAKDNVPGIQLVSGQSASTFKNVLLAIFDTPYKAMLRTLESERYNCVVVPESEMKAVAQAIPAAKATTRAVEANREEAIKKARVDAAKKALDSF